MAGTRIDCDTIVIGAGLAGLTCGSLLHEAGLDVIVLEAADRIGGRIHSVVDRETGGYVADLGPTWVWPAYQPVAAQWLERLNVETFAQFEDGDAVLDFATDAPVRRQPLPGQHGIRRIAGGPQALVNALYRRLPPDRVLTGHRVTAVDAGDTEVTVTIGAEGKSYNAARVVIAAPLRLADETISWSPPLDPQLRAALAQTPTWMAAQAKAVAVYDAPFWRTAGLSGRVASGPGPLVEVHDHSSEDDGTAALFGFVGWPPEQRLAHPELLRDEITRQLVRCFGERGGAFSALHIEDWAANDAICSTLDLTRPPAHPEVTPDILRTPHLDGRLFFAVAETALQSPGLIEGALAAGQSAAGAVVSAMSDAEP